MKNTIVYNYLEINNKIIYYKLILNENTKKNTPFLVFLHNGLGSIEEFGEFPEMLCNKLNFNGFVYDREGYGKSEKVYDYFDENYFFEQSEVLNQIFQKFNINKLIFIGYSDGGTISLINSADNKKVLATISLASHIQSEEKLIFSIQNLNRELIISKLSKFHNNPKLVFDRWYIYWENSRNWNIENFLKNLNIPILHFQGELDEYGSELQFNYLQKINKSKVIIIPNTNHNLLKNNKEFIINEIYNYLKITEII